MKLKVHTQIGIAIVAGIAAGLLLGERAGHLEIVGRLFIRLLKMIMIPLIMASIVTGIISLGDVRKLGRIGTKTLVYYTVTTLLAITVGLILVNLIRPGDSFEAREEFTTKLDASHEPPSIGSIITDAVPEHVVGAMAEGQVLPVIFFSLLLGAAIGATGEAGRPVLDFFTGLNAVMMKLTGWIMRLAPYGVFALMADTIGNLGLDVIKHLAFYMVTVVVGLGFHAVVTLPLLVLLLARYHPWRLWGDVFSAVTTAFSTASSAATLPVTMDCLEHNTGVSNQTASFVLPLGATINMDGTALYEAVAAMFIAQVYGIDLSLSQQLIIMVTATLASVGAAAIPSAGLVTMVIVLESVNLPLEGIGMIWAVDRLLDMCRTAVNVWGDSCGTAIVARMEGETLRNR
jgi:proton glutamate symport protein